MKTLGLKKLIYILPILLLGLGGCTDSKRVNIKCKFTSIDQADFLIFSPDGGLQEIDTLHLKKGIAEKSFPITDTTTFILLYPNFQRLTFRAAPGDNITIKGDALDLGNVRVKPLYPLKEETQQAPTPESRKLTGKVRRILNENLKKVDPDFGDLGKEHLIREIDKKRYLLLTFAANWRGQSSSSTYVTRELLLDYPNEFQAITVSLDNDSSMCSMGMLRDRVTWPYLCDCKGWQTPLVSLLHIDNIPYSILYAPDGKVIASGTNFNRDLTPEIDKLKEKLKSKD